MEYLSSFSIKKRQHPQMKAALTQQTYLGHYLTVIESSVIFVTVFLAPG